MRLNSLKWLKFKLYTNTMIHVGLHLQIQIAHVTKHFNMQQSQVYT